MVTKELEYKGEKLTMTAKTAFLETLKGQRVLAGVAFVGFLGLLLAGIIGSLDGTTVAGLNEANAEQAYKQAIVDYASADIVNSNLFTGVHGNYLRPSIVAAGLDPDKLPDGDVASMNFGSGGDTSAKIDKTAEIISNRLGDFVKKGL